MNILRRVVNRYQGFKLRRLIADELESTELRKVFSERFQIEVGMYSYGCFDATRIPAGTKVGRYCSFAAHVQVFNGNHGISFLTTHPYLYNPRLGLVGVEKIKRNVCVFEDDVWVGYGAIVLPAVRVVGRGSVIAAGSVVTRDVPPYAIVAGNPATVKRYRFPVDVIEKIEQSRWWLLDKAGLREFMGKNSHLVYDPEGYFAESTDS